MSSSEWFTNTEPPCPHCKEKAKRRAWTTCYVSHGVTTYYLEEWMQGSARRARDWNGAIIRTSSAEDHVRDLIEAGILTPLD